MEIQAEMERLRSVRLFRWQKRSGSTPSSATEQHVADVARGRLVLHNGLALSVGSLLLLLLLLCCRCLFEVGVVQGLLSPPLLPLLLLLLPLLLLPLFVTVCAASSKSGWQAVC